MSTPRKTGTRLTERRKLAAEVRRQMSLYTTALQPYINNAQLAEDSLIRALETLIELNKVHSESQAAVTRPDL